jgi:hypothetical protein
MNELSFSFFESTIGMEGSQQFFLLAVEKKRAKTRVRFPAFFLKQTRARACFRIMSESPPEERGGIMRLAERAQGGSLF